MAAVALICMTLTLFMTSCSKESDERNNVVSYSASGSIHYIGTDISGESAIEAGMAVPDYVSAIKSVVGDYNTSEKDAEVIAACEKVYQKHLAKNPKWSGEVTITKYVGLTDNTGTTIKTYTYK